jgi:hypothetical protein
MEGGRINLTEYGKGLFTKRTAGVYPPKMRKLLSQVGSQGIHSILVVRTPLSGFVTTLLNAISLGSYDNALKQSPYDKMFHLCLFINGDYILEKNGVVEFRRGNPIKKGTERSDVTNVPLKGKESLTIQQAIDITREKMGNDQFSVYKADSWNCQDFVLNFLEANGLSSESLKQFILQDPKEIFGRMPQFAKNIGQALTDIDAVVNKITEGEGVDPEKTRELIRQTIDVLNDCYAEVQAEDFPEGLGVDVESYIDHNMLDAVNRLYGQPMTPATHVNRIPLRLLRRYDDREIELMLQRLRRLLRILKSRDVEQIEDEIKGKENRPPTPPPPPTYPPTDQTPLQDITNVMGTGMCCMCKRVKVGGSYVMYQNGECWTVLNQSTGRVLAYCTTEEKAKKQIDMLNRMKEQEELEKGYEKDKADIKKSGDDYSEKVKAESKKIKRTYKKKDKMQETWKEFYAKQTKGKKFANRAEVNAWMKKCSVDYKAMKAKSK